MVCVTVVGFHCLINLLTPCHFTLSYQHSLQLVLCYDPLNHASWCKCCIYVAALLPLLIIAGDKIHILKICPSLISLCYVIKMEKCTIEYYCLLYCLFAVFACALRPGNHCLFFYASSCFWSIHPTCKLKIKPVV